MKTLSLTEREWPTHIAIVLQGVLMGAVIAAILTMLYL
jgi:hypothetical protein